MAFFMTSPIPGDKKSNACCGHMPDVINVLNVLFCTVPLDLNFAHARVQKATAHNIHGNAPE